MSEANSNKTRVATEMRSAALLEFFTMEQSLRAAANHLATAEAIATGHDEPSGDPKPLGTAGLTFCTVPIPRPA